VEDWLLLHSQLNREDNVVTLISGLIIYSHCDRDVGPFRHVHHGIWTQRIPLKVTLEVASVFVRKVFPAGGVSPIACLIHDRSNMGNVAIRVVHLKVYVQRRSIVRFRLAIGVCNHRASSCPFVRLAPHRESLPLQKPPYRLLLGLPNSGQSLFTQPTPWATRL